MTHLAAGARLVLAVEMDFRAAVAHQGSPAPDVAADQQLDQAGWKTLVEQMASRGISATDDELDQIVQYLTKAFPPAK